MLLPPGLGPRIPNSQATYKRLSDLTSQARLAGDFPDFSDESHSIRRSPWWIHLHDFADDAADSSDWTGPVARHTTS